MPTQSTTDRKVRHTPGPWFHAPLSDDIISRRGVPVAAPPDGYDEDQWKANAAVIAAAPDMVVALEMFIEDHDRSGRFCAGLNAAYAVAREVVAKAKGGR